MNKQNNSSTDFAHISKRLLVFSALAFVAAFGYAQSPQTQSYDDFEGAKSVMYNVKAGGSIDTAAKNPAPDNVNGSMRSAKYTRSSDKKFDNVKMQVLGGKLADASAYATYSGTPPKLKMKIYTDAPAGTLVEILLGSRSGNNEYPAGTHSQYQARTTKTGEWEELEFHFAQIPQGSLTASTDIDQITLLFNPNSNASAVYYFDDITGPAIVHPITKDNADVTGQNKK